MDTIVGNAAAAVSKLTSRYDDDVCDEDIIIRTQAKTIDNDVRPLPLTSYIIHRVPKITVHYCFCQNFVKFP